MIPLELDPLAPEPERTLRPSGGTVRCWPWFVGGPWDGRQVPDLELDEVRFPADGVAGLPVGRYTEVRVQLVPDELVVRFMCVEEQGLAGWERFKMCCRALAKAALAEVPQ